MSLPSHKNRLAEQRDALKNEIQALCRDGRLRHGDPIPPVRELSEKFAISKSEVARTLQELIAQGVLHSVPRAGTFAGPSEKGSDQFYVLLLHENPDVPELFERQGQLRVGFEDRIAGLGGACASLGQSQMSLWDAASAPVPDGVFEFGFGLHDTPWAHPSHSGSVARVASFVLGDRMDADFVGFDDADGGRQAARHLLARGHRDIAYLGLHTPEEGSPQLWWSAEREAGYADVLQNAGMQSVAYHPRVEPHNVKFESQVEAARVAAAPLVARLAPRCASGTAASRAPDAVVTANDFAAHGLWEALRAADVPSDRWPAVVSFDAHPIGRPVVLTSLLLPWDELGRQAAELLWGRRHGRWPNEPQQRLVPMRLIPRLTCRPLWSRTPASLALALGTWKP